MEYNNVLITNKDTLDYYMVGNGKWLCNVYTTKYVVWTLRVINTWINQREY